MQKSRPKSASTCTHNKPLMQTKYKQRTGNGSVLNDSRYMSQSFLLQEDTKDAKSVRNSEKQRENKKRSHSVILDRSIGFENDVRNSSQLKIERNQKQKQKQKDSKRGSASAEKQRRFQHTSSLDKDVVCKIITQNFKHHDLQKCVCEFCTCGRHLCKLHGEPPNLTKVSTYGKDYNKKSASPPVIVIAKEYDKLNGPHLSMNSSYLKDYPGKNNDDLSRPKPEDLLKTGGPCLELTSYTAQYPGHRGPNQYVKPTDKHRRQKFPLRGRTTYNNSFLGIQGKPDDWQGLQDCLKTGNGWYCNTSYNNSFKAPNPQNYAKIVKKKQKLQINPDYKRQYQTTYGNHFLNPPAAVCPAKIALETKRQGQFKNSKIRFMENSDYKSMSPEFRSYSANRCH